jgi:hypothetical protein
LGSAECRGKLKIILEWNICMVGLKERLGLKITFTPIGEKGHPVFFVAAFNVGYGVPSHDFISTEEIRGGIDNYNKWAPSMGQALLRTGGLLGSITMRIEKNRKGAVWTGVYPFKVEGGVQSLFRKRGIAQILEWRVLNEAKKRFPLLKSIRHADRGGMTALRDTQLKRRNSNPAKSINPTKRIKFELEREKLRERIRADTLKHRKPKIRPRPARKP